MKFVKTHESMNIELSRWFQWIRTKIVTSQNQKQTDIC